MGFVDMSNVGIHRVDCTSVIGQYDNNNTLLDLQVRLYHDENPGVPIHTVSLGMVSFFYLPSLQMDDKVGLTSFATQSYL